MLEDDDRSLVFGFVLELGVVWGSGLCMRWTVMGHQKEFLNKFMHNTLATNWTFQEAVSHGASDANEPD